MADNVSKLLAKIAGTSTKRKAKGLPKRTTNSVRKARYARYYDRYQKRNKLRRILKRNGASAAEKWAKDHAAEGDLRRIMEAKARL